MRLLVTGSTGLLGNNVVRQLVARGDEVRVLVRSSADPRPLEGLRVEVITGDVTSVQDIEDAVEGVDAVIHCAGVVRIGWSDAETFHRVNVEGTQLVAKAARKQGARLVHVSTINTLGVATRRRVADETWADPRVVLCPYVTSKRAGESVVREQIGEGLDAVIVHPGFMLGPWDWKPSSGEMILEVARRWTPLAPTGGVSVCDVRDVAEGVLSALERGRRGESYVLGGENLRYWRLWKLIAEVSGGSAPWVPAGPINRMIGGAFGDLWGKVTGVEPAVNSAAAKMASQLHFFSSDKAKRELGYTSRPARESITDAWHWFLEHGYVDRSAAPR